MRRLNLWGSPGADAGATSGPGVARPLRVLALGAHADDIEIGCGGTLLRLLREHPDVDLHWVVLSAVGERADEATAAATAFGAGARLDLRLHGYPESYFPAEWAGVKDTVQALAGLDPDVVFTHCSGDLHQDHRVVSELTWNAFRDHVVLEYEVPKVDGDLGRPNVFVELPADIVRRKVALLDEHFPSQRHRCWFDPEVFAGLARLRGVEGITASGYAEGFFGRKLVL